jgi:hypothetical protein
MREIESGRGRLRSNGERGDECNENCLFGYKWALDEEIGRVNIQKE